MDSSSTSARSFASTRGSSCRRGHVKDVDPLDGDCRGCEYFDSIDAEAPTWVNDLINDFLRGKRKLEYEMELKKMDRAGIVLEEIDTTMKELKVLNESKKEDTKKRKL
ncbi:hypothetical protein GH714_015054 [Hevea brasiliensis]|uniref:Uncharacterized protein n=1 Tax=Hevea brasiliensis TaxID=3981 RepID=A0A6A6L9L3_HEVBR|nr:hypothetical protein GH714_015054 [Hevea brasiliensis]